MWNKPKEKIDYKLVMETLEQVEKRKDTIKTILADNDPALEMITKLQGEISEHEKIIETKKAEIASILEEISESDNRISAERNEIIQLLLSINIDPLTYDLWIPNLPATAHEPVRRRRRSSNKELPEISLAWISEEILNIPLENMSFKVRTYNALVRNGFKTLGEIRALSSHKLKEYRMIWVDCLEDIQDVFARYGVLEGRY